MEEKDWPVTEKRFIVFIDIMGFKDMVMRKTHGEVLDKLSSLIDSVKTIDESYGKKTDPKTILRTITFSDSILIVSKTNTLDDLNDVINVAAFLIHTSFILNLPIKGAISMGTFTADFKKSLFFGQPLIDAYLLQDELLLYGIALDGYAEEFLSDKLSNFKFCKKYLTPSKTGKVNYNLIHPFSHKNWLEKYHEGFKGFYKTAIGRSRLYVDNTAAFFDFCIANSEVKENKLTSK